jgi:hypothetical protein
MRDWYRLFFRQREKERGAERPRVAKSERSALRAAVTRLGEATGLPLTKSQAMHSVIQRFEYLEDGYLDKLLVAIENDDLRPKK